MGLNPQSNGFLRAITMNTISIIYFLFDTLLQAQLIPHDLNMGYPFYTHLVRDTLSLPAKPAQRIRDHPTGRPLGLSQNCRIEPGVNRPDKGVSPLPRE